MMLTGCPPIPSPDTVFKNIYKIVDGKLQIVKTIRGTVVPKVTEEHIEWEN